jgi:large subunit ribosomal protein L31
MKTEIHPEYVVAHVRCTCGNDFYTRATRDEYHLEICSECHPFYTGRQKLVDTGGRVERFQRRAALGRAGRTGSAKAKAERPLGESAANAPAATQAPVVEAPAAEAPAVEAPAAEAPAVEAPAAEAPAAEIAADGVAENGSHDSGAVAAEVAAADANGSAAEPAPASD